MDRSPRTQVNASAPGKVIIFGEHFVVYNNEAIVAAINRRCFGKAEFTENLGVQIDSDHNSYAMQHLSRRDAQANNEWLEPLNTFCQNLFRSYAPELGLQIHIKSELAPGVGLGSSAASCVMLTGILRAIITGNLSNEISSCDRKWVFENALNGEQMIHTKTSGVDCYISTYGGLVHFAGLTRTVGSSLIEGRPLPLFLINTRKSHETFELVSQVRKFSRNRPVYFKELINYASEICSSGAKAITKGSLEEIGQLMTENQRMLREVGVSNMEIEKIIEICFKCGSLGAKITGAGGGGCLLVLARPETIPALSAALKDLNLWPEAIDIANRGLVID